MKFIIFLIVLVAAYGIYEYQRISPLYKTGIQLADDAIPFERVLDSPAKRVLVLGDSTGIGTGSSSPELSVAGRLATQFEDWSIENRAVNGAKLAEVLNQIEEGDDYDLIILHAGGNDVLRMKSRSAMKKDARALLEAVSNVSEDVVWVSSGNIGASYFFPVVTRPVLSWRSKVARRLFMSLADEFGSRTTYVDLFEPRSEDVFYAEPDKYYADDLLHPSEEGYAIWFEQIVEQGNLRSSSP
jgi:lysophospholipase L1-like esterase